MTEARLLVAVGLFGLMVTFGLFIYEIRQVDTCKQLERRAAQIECRLGSRAGLFGGHRPRLRIAEIYWPPARRRRKANIERTEKEEARHEGPAGRMGAEAAGFIVDHTVMVAWLAVAAVGIWHI